MGRSLPEAGSVDGRLIRGAISRLSKLIYSLSNLHTSVMLSQRRRKRAIIQQNFLKLCREPGRESDTVVAARCVEMGLRGRPHRKAGIQIPGVPPPRRRGPPVEPSVLGQCQGPQGPPDRPHLGSPGRSFGENAVGETGPAGTRASLLWVGERRLGPAPKAGRARAWPAMRVLGAGHDRADGALPSATPSLVAGHQGHLSMAGPRGRDAGCQGSPECVREPDPPREGRQQGAEPRCVGAKWGEREDEGVCRLARPSVRDVLDTLPSASPRSAWGPRPDVQQQTRREGDPQAVYPFQSASHPPSFHRTPK